MRLTFLFLFILLSPVNTQAKKSLSPSIEKRLSETFNYLTKRVFLKLDNPKLQMSFYSIDNPNYFMESNFHIIKRLILGKKAYRIGVNPLIFKNDISNDALLGVMAHEMMHTLDYENRKIVSVGWKMLSSKRKNKYERRTDLRVVFLGLGHHLKEYRLWQYPLLSPDALKRKKKGYLSVEEISYVRNALDQLDIDNRKKLKRYWLNETPNDLQSFKRSFIDFLYIYNL